MHFAVDTLEKLWQRKTLHRRMREFLVGVPATPATVAAMPAFFAPQHLVAYFGVALKARPRGQSPVVIAHAWNARHRLHTRYQRLAFRKLPQVAVV